MTGPGSAVAVHRPNPTPRAGRVAGPHRRPLLPRYRPDQRPCRGDSGPATGSRTHRYPGPCPKTVPGPTAGRGSIGSGERTRSGRDGPGSSCAGALGWRYRYPAGTGPREASGQVVARYPVPAGSPQVAAPRDSGARRRPSPGEYRPQAPVEGAPIRALPVGPQALPVGAPLPAAPTGITPAHIPYPAVTSRGRACPPQAPKPRPEEASGAPGPRYLPPSSLPPAGTP